MKYFARKLNESKYSIALMSKCTCAEIESDFIGSELKSKKNKFSTWEIEADEDTGKISNDSIEILKRIFIFSQGSVKNNFSIVFISEELIKKYKFIMDEPDFGNSVYILNEKIHRNINSNNVEGVLTFLEMIKESCKKKENIIEVKFDNISDSVKEVLKNGLIDTSKIRDELVSSISSNIIKNDEQLLNEIKYSIEISSKDTYKIKKK